MDFIDTSVCDFYLH